MGKIALMWGSDYLDGERLKSGESLRITWPDGFVGVMPVYLTSGRAFVVMDVHGIELPVYLYEQAMNIERVTQPPLTSANYEFCPHCGSRNVTQGKPDKCPDCKNHLPPRQGEPGFGKYA
jgi:hypothetical protein